MSKYKRLNRVTLPTLSFKDRTVAYVKVTAPMTKSDDVTKNEDGRNQATVMRVVDLEDGGEYLLICPALLVSTLKNLVEDYVGRCYEIIVSADKAEGKSYKTVEVYYISDPAGELIIGTNKQGDKTHGQADATQG